MEEIVPRLVGKGLMAFRTFSHHFMNIFMLRWTENLVPNFSFWFYFLFIHEAEKNRKKDNMKNLPAV